MVGREHNTSAIYFGEYQNVGPGARVKHRSLHFNHIKSPTDASFCTIRNFLNGSYEFLCNEIPCNLDLM